MACKAKQTAPGLSFVEVCRVDRKQSLCVVHNGERFAYMLLPWREDYSELRTQAFDAFRPATVTLHDMRDAPTPEPELWDMGITLALCKAGHTGPGVWCAIRRDDRDWKSAAWACWTPTRAARSGYALVQTDIEGSRQHFKLIAAHTGCAVLQGIETLAYATHCLKQFATLFPDALKGATFGAMDGDKHPRFNDMRKLARSLKR